MSKFQFVTNGDDWQGLYVNDVLVVQGHTLSARDWLNAIDTVAYAEAHEVSQDWLESVGDLPESFKRIPEDSFL